MKLTRKCVFLSVILSAVIVLIGLWSGLGNYLTVNRNKYPVHGKYLWESKIDSHRLFDNSATDLDQANDRPNNFQNSSFEPGIFLNKSTPFNERGNTTLYITCTLAGIGRLGNKMFVYASLLGIALAQGRTMLQFPDSGLDKTFTLQSNGYNYTVNDWTTINESKPASFDPKLMKLPLQNVKIHGFLQSFIYFSDIMDRVRQEFTFRDNIANEAAAIVNDVRAKYRPSLIVGVHARRRFALGLQHKGFAVPQKSYFIKAFDWMRSTFHVRNITFIIASDDLPWCQANLTGNDVVVMPPATPAVHLAVLSSCDHVIISGGTFGWWAGWLAGGRVIYFTGYMAAGTHLGNKSTPIEYYPRLWTGMGD